MKNNIQCYRSWTSRFVLGASLTLVTSGTMGAIESNAETLPSSIVTGVAQQRTIKGTVVDPEGIPVIGANVLEKGTTNGVITDFDGNFSLQVSGDCILEISFVGYKKQEIKITSATRDLAVTLKEDTELLDEVVVVGYGTQKKVNLTGSVASVDFEEQAKSRPITTVSAALAGLSPGLQAMQSSGEPGSDGATLRIRGTGTLNEAGPLVIIDGMEGTLDALNPQDIENISILKDAASCAIYGVRGANGVVLVTTKQGDRDKIRVNYSGRISFAKPSNLIEMMSNYADYMELMNESCVNVGSTPLFSQSNIDLWREKSLDPNGVTENGVPNYVAYPNTDWARELFTNGMVHDHNLSVNGGSEKIRFQMSVGYMDNQGIVDNTGMKRYSIRANVEANPTKWLTVGTRTYASQQDKEVADFSNANTFLRQSTAGTYPIWGEGENRFGYPECSDERSTANNPLYKLARSDGFKRYNRFNTTIYSKIKIIEGLSYDFNFNYNRYIYETKSWGTSVGQTRFSDGTQPDGGAPNASQLSTSFGYQSDYKYTLENLLNYAKTINQSHDITALLGYQEVYYNSYDVDASKKGLISDQFNQFDNATDMTSIGGSAADYASRSVFGRVTYGYKSRYLLEGNFRYDGSSRFYKDNRWGFFPSFSGAWRISEESFMEKTRSWLDNLKIRLSWGKLGNSEVGNYPYQAVYNNVNYVFGNLLTTGLAATKLSNVLLQWESTTSTNLGIDATFLNGRLNFTADLYDKNTDDILYQPDLLPSIGDKTKPYQNIATVNNKGVEVTLGWQDNIGGFHYSVTGNFAYNHNEVTKFKGKLEEGWTVDEEGNKVYHTNIGEVSTGSSTRVIEGHQINEYYLRNVYKGDGSYYNADGSVNINGGPKDGMIRTEADAQWVKDMMAAGYSFKPGNSFDKSHIYYGDFIYADSNGDGVYGGDNDQTFQGFSSTPKYNYGFQLSASYKGFDFSMNWAGAAGFKIYWGSTTGLNSSTTEHGSNIPQEIADDHYFYDPENPSDPRTNVYATYPRMAYIDGADQNKYESTHWLFNGNYLKLKNVTFGYTLPKAWTNKISAQTVRLYVSAENVLNFNSFMGQDPEVGATGYAPNKSVAIGANITF